MLEVMRDHFGITAPRMRREIQGLHRELIEILGPKGVRYENLRAALVPVMDRHEAAFIFDSTAFDSGLYGRETFKHVLPLLEPKATCGQAMALPCHSDGSILPAHRRLDHQSQPNRESHAASLDACDPSSQSPTRPGVSFRPGNRVLGLRLPGLPA